MYLRDTMRSKSVLSFTEGVFFTLMSLADVRLYEGREGGGVMRAHLCACRDVYGVLEHSEVINRTVPPKGHPRVISHSSCSQGGGSSRTRRRTQ